MENFIQLYGNEIIVTILTAVFSYIGLCLKNAYTKYINTKTKEKVVITVVNAVEQIYKDLEGSKKLEKAKEAIMQMLEEKGINITDIEINMLIESVVSGFNNNIKEVDTNDKDSEKSNK